MVSSATIVSGTLYKLLMIQITYGYLPKGYTHYRLLWETYKVYFKIRYGYDVLKPVSENKCPICFKHVDTRFLLKRHLAKSHKTELYHDFDIVSRIYTDYISRHKLRRTRRLDLKYWSHVTRKYYNSLEEALTDIVSQALSIVLGNPV